MRNKINTIVMSMLLVLCAAVSMFGMNVFAADEATAIDGCTRIVEAYDLDEAETYINDDDASTYPITDTDGYIFAGWYTDKACGEDAYWGQEEPGNTVYALFVPSHILSVKAQLSANLLDKDTSNDSSASMRFVTTVDTLLYTQAGFELSYIGTDGTIKNTTSSSNKVYKRLYAVGSKSEEYTEEDIQEYAPEETFCGLSTYFKACTVNGIGSAYYDTKFTVKPFWRTMDGSIVYGETAEKSIADYFDAKEVWVSTTGTDAPIGYGTYTKPYETLDYAIEHVKDGGSVRVVGDMTIAADTTWAAHGKSITITNDGQDAKTGSLTFAAGTVEIQDSVKFTDLGLNFAYYAESTDSEGNVTKDYADVYACGNKLEIDSNVTGLAEPITLYGGAKSTKVASTNVVLRAGSYLIIYGGGASGDVAGDTNVIIGADVNAAIVDHTSHDHTYMLFGGCKSGTVSGDTHVTVETGAEFNYIYGAGHAKASVVEGSTNVDFSGNAMSIYGGSRSGTNADTHVVVRSGEVYQVFGGCEANSMTGDTDVRILDGAVRRRVYGGCYNEADESVSMSGVSLSWSTKYQVNGYTSVTIADEAELKFDYTKSYLGGLVTIDADDSLVAYSRYGSIFSGETGVIIFNDNSYDANSELIGVSYSPLSISSGTPSQYYDYLVKAGVGGQVHGEGNGLRVIPDENKVATVRVGSATGNVIHYTEDTEVGSVCTLPALTSDTMEIYVVFEESTPSDVNIGNYEAKIGQGYYATVEEAVAVANATSTKETVTVAVLKDAEIASDMEITGNVTITNAENTNVAISRAATLTGANVLSVSSGATLNIVGTTDENSIVLDGKAISSTASLIHSEAGSVLFVKNTTIKNAVNTNTSTASGSSGTSGAVYAAGTTLEIENSKFIGNSGTYGGAVRVAASTTATIANCVFGEEGEGNVATKDGGAIYNQSTKGMTIVDSQIMCNTAPRAGALYNNGGTAVVKNSKFANNTATSTANGSGGAIYNASSAKLKLTAQNGDGNSELASFVNNESGDARAAYGGGAICIGSGTLNITGYRFEGNHATVSGGAVCVRAGSKTTIKNATFSGNYTTGANGYGGAIFVEKANTTIANAIFTENYTSGSEAHGGAVYLASEAASTVITDQTYADNAVIGEGAEGPDIYIEGSGSGTTPAGGLNGTDLGSGGEDDEIIEF